MKKLLITLAIVSTTMMAQETAQEQPINVNIAELKKAIIRTFADGHVPPIELDENGNIIRRPKPMIQDVATHHKLSPEQMTNILEEIIRERLTSLPNTKGDEYTYLTINIGGVIPLLKTFRGPNTLALLRECVQTKNATICIPAVETYLLIQEGEGDSVSFLREVNEQKCLYSIYRFGQFLKGIIATLEEKNKTDVVENYFAFLLDVIMPAQNASDVFVLDKLLCEILEGYAQSVQREQIIQKFLVSENDLVRKNFNEIKLEINKVTADERTDFSKRFKAWEEIQ